MLRGILCLPQAIPTYNDRDVIKYSPRTPLTPEPPMAKDNNISFFMRWFMATPKDAERGDVPELIYKNHRIIYRIKPEQG